MVAKEKTNLSNTKQDSKVNNFISLRKENTKFRTNEIKEPFLKSDQYVNGYTPSYSTLKENRKLGNSGSIYTSANGITYERTSSDGVVQTTLDFPKNALDIPGKNLFISIIFKDSISLCKIYLKVNIMNYIDILLFLMKSHKIFVTNSAQKTPNNCSLIK